MLKKGILFGAILATITCLFYQVSSLNRELGAVTTIAEARQARINNLENQRSLSIKAEQELAAVIARQRIAADKQKKQLEKIIRENAELQAWADSPLPAELNSLQHPAITGAAAYNNLPDFNPVHTQRADTANPP